MPISKPRNQTCFTAILRHVQLQFSNATGLVCKTRPRRHSHFRVLKSLWNIVPPIASQKQILLKTYEPLGLDMLQRSVCAIAYAPSFVEDYGPAKRLRNLPRFVRASIVNYYLLIHKPIWDDFTDPLQNKGKSLRTVLSPHNHCQLFPKNLNSSTSMLSRPAPATAASA